MNKEKHTYRVFKAMSNNEWKPSSSGKLYKTICDGEVLVVKSVGQISGLLSCPVCESLIKNQLDAQEAQNYQCCAKCSLKWAQPNHKRWLDGWRPSKEEVSMEISHRKKTNLVTHKPVYFK